MAFTNYGVNHPLAVKIWAKELFHETLQNVWFSKFMGNDSNALIQVKGETSRGAGDRIRVGLRMLLNGQGVQGDDTLEGNEEALVTFNQDTYINQLRHAVRSNGAMSEQRVPFDVRQEAKQGLADWWAKRIEVWAANQLTGNTGVTNTIFTGNNPTVAPDAAHQIFANTATSENTLDTTTTGTAPFLNYNFGFNLQMIDRAIVRARTITPRIRPLNVNGDQYYVCFLHPYQVFQLRTNTNSGQWLDIQKAAMAGIDAKESPVFTGALGIYNQTILHECPYLPLFPGNLAGATGVCRAVFCGAQSAILAYGQDSSGGRMKWAEKYFDYENQLGVKAGMIAGMQKTNYNNTDFATITLSTYSPAQ
jgi:N4-gp56 family major capsid protein